MLSESWPALLPASNNSCDEVTILSSKPRINTARPARYFSTLLQRSRSSKLRNSGHAQKKG